MKLVYLVIVLFICWLKQLISATKYMHLYEKMKDHRFQDPLSGYVAASAIACCEMCSRFRPCSLVSYNKQTKACELSFLIPGAEVQIQPELGWDVYFDAGDSCANNPCEGCQDRIGYHECPVTCPDDWKKIGKSCYYIETQKLNWTAAQKNCVNKANRGNLVIIQYEKENDRLSEFVYEEFPTSDEQIWIGAADYETNVFYWVDATKVQSGTTFWDFEQPNYSNGIDCVSSTVYMQWSVADCAIPMWSICENELE